MMQIIGGKHKRRHLIAPKTLDVRPTASKLREAFFNICQQKIEGARFLDLFAGSGAMGLEAISRGALHATFVEKNHLALSALKKNIAQLQEEENTTVVAMEVIEALKRFDKLKEQFDLIYVDPPYEASLGDAAVAFIDTHAILVDGGELFLEESSTQEFSLKRLELKSRRKVGRTILRQYRYKL